MTFMLVFIFLCVALGLLVHQIGTRERIAITFLAATMTAMYLVLGKF